MSETQAAAGSQSSEPAPAKAGAGHFMWRRTLRHVLFLIAILSTGALLVDAEQDGIGGGVALAREAPVFAYRDGPPLGFSGGFGEDHCQACHVGERLNSEPGSLTIAIPERYAPGEVYPVTVTLKRPGMKIGGFMLTARFEEDSTQAGTLTLPLEQRDSLRILLDRGVQYASHRRIGARLSGPDVARWTLLWTAPEGKRPVVFHVAGNAANFDEANSGDFVYTARARSHGR